MERERTRTVEDSQTHLAADVAISPAPSVVTSESDATPPVTRAAVAATRRQAMDAARAALRPPATYTALAALFAALADPTRARIVHLLMGHEWSTSEIAEITGATRPATSQHLGVLRRLHLVRAQRAGQRVEYRLDDAHVAALVRTSLAHLGDAADVSDEDHD